MKLARCPRCSRLPRVRPEADVPARRRTRPAPARSATTAAWWSSEPGSQGADLPGQPGPVVVHLGARRHSVHPVTRGATRHHRHLGQRHGAGQLGSPGPAPGSKRTAPGSSSPAAGAAAWARPRRCRSGTEPPHGPSRQHGGRVVRMGEIPDDYILGGDARRRRRRGGRGRARPERRSEHGHGLVPTPPPGRRRARRGLPYWPPRRPGRAPAAALARRGAGGRDQMILAAPTMRLPGRRSRLPRGGDAARAESSACTGAIPRSSPEPPGLARSTAARAGGAAGLQRLAVAGDRRCLRRHRAAALGPLAGASADPAGPDGARRHPGAGGLRRGRVDGRADRLSPSWHGSDAERRCPRLHHRPRRRCAARRGLHRRPARPRRGAGSRVPPRRLGPGGSRSPTPPTPTAPRSPCRSRTPRSPPRRLRHAAGRGPRPPPRPVHRREPAAAGERLRRGADRDAGRRPLDRVRPDAARARGGGRTLVPRHRRPPRRGRSGQLVPRPDPRTPPAARRVPPGPRPPRARGGRGTARRSGRRPRARPRRRPGTGRSTASRRRPRSASRPRTARARPAAASRPGRARARAAWPAGDRPGSGAATGASCDDPGLAFGTALGITVPLLAEASPNISRRTGARVDPGSTSDQESRLRPVGAWSRPRRPRRAGRGGPARSGSRRAGTPAPGQPGRVQDREVAA